MVLTKLNIAWAYLILLILIKDYPISILSINTIQIWNESTIVALNMLNGMYYCYKNEPKSYFIL
jgi:hypothetical protein